MKRLFFGLFIALALALATGVTPTSAAPGAPPSAAGRGVGGQVSSVDGTTINVTTRDGSAKIATTSTTTFEINGASGGLSGIAAGMFVRAEGTKATDGSFTATRVVASTTRPTPPAGGPRGHGVGGQVSSVDGTTINVTTRDGTAKIATTSTTTFEINGASGSLSGIAAGMFVRAEGTKATDGSFTATRVVASSTAPSGGQPPKGDRNGRGVGGQVSSVDGTTINVTTRDGTAKIATTSTTTFEINGASGSLSGIAAGMFVRAEGTKATDGSFTATRVVASSTRPAPPSRPHA